MVIAHHAGQAYGDTGGTWVVSDYPKLSYLNTFFFFNASYMMGLFFFISGYFTQISLNHKKIKGYIKDRFIKLGFPILIFGLFIFGPIHYFIDSSKSNYFYYLIDLHFNRAPLSFGHLWFLGLLLFLTTLHLIIYISSKKNIKSKYSSIKSFKFYYPLLYVLFLIPINVLVRNWYPVDKWITILIPLEPAHLPQYLSMFFIGVIFSKNKWLDSIKPNIALIYSFIGLSILLFRNFINNNMQLLWAESVIESLTCIGMCFGLFSLFKYSNCKMCKLTELISKNSYNIYIIHLLVVVIIQLILLNFTINTNIKFILVTILTIIFSTLISQVIKNILAKKSLLSHPFSFR